jgi:hypothetical protein
VTQQESSGGFVTVTLLGGARACLNLSRVSRFQESEGAAVFYLDGEPIRTRDDFEALALKLGAEVHPAIPREQLPLLAHR